MKIHASNILWDLDGDDVDVDLPNEIEIEISDGGDFNEKTVDYLTDQYGFTIIALNIEIMG
jgi:hypothetical protein